MAYKYQEIGTNPFELRLVKIQPAWRWGDQLHLSLEHASLENSAKMYFALSYTWGRYSSDAPKEWDDPDYLMTVYVNGKRFRIRPNLYNALLEFRQHWSPECLWWIDALCINQRNVSERNNLVRRMADIYAYASATVVWLGRADDTTSLAVSTIQEMSRFWRRRPDYLKALIVDAKHIDRYAEILHTEASWNSTPRCAAVGQLLSRSWWERAWVCQEVSVASNVILQIDEYRVTWDALQETNYAFGQHYHSMKDVKTMDMRLVAKMKTMVNLVLRDNFQFAQLGLIISLSKTETMNATSRPNLLNLLPQFRSKLSMDPRDKVFAAVGISDGSDIVRIDYSLSTQAIYMDVVKRCVRASRNLHILRHCKFPPLLQNLPSWAPDWTDCEAAYGDTSGRRHTVLQEIGSDDKIYYATKNTIPDIVFESDRVMSIKGGLFDRIAFVSSKNVTTMSLGHPDYLEVMRENDTRENLLWAASCGAEWLRQWADSGRSADNPSQSINWSGWKYQPSASKKQFETPHYLPTEQSLIEAYLCTLASKDSDEFATYRELPAGELFESVSEPLINNGIFAVSHCGRFALVPEEAKTEDHVAFFQGGEVAYVLRPVEDHFLFIGECYLHGFMQGEAWDKIERDGLVEYLRIV